MLNDYSFLTKSNTTTPTVKTPDYSFLTRTSKPKQEDEIIKADNFKVVRLPLNMGGGEYVTNPQGDLYLTPRSQDSLGGTLPGKERDHIVPVSLGGTSNTSNLQYLESKPSFWQKIGGIFGKKPTVQQSPNRQEGKLKVEQSAINEYKAGKISLPEARLKIAMENIRIQGIIPEQKKETTWGNLGAGYKDAFNQVFGGLAKEMASTVVGSFDFLHRTGLQAVRGVGTVVSPLVVSIFKLLGDKQLKGISHDEIWRDALKDDVDRMLDIGRPDEYFRARITGDTFVPSMLLHDEITGLLESSNKKWSEDGDGKGATVDWLKAGGLKFMTEWANPFYLFAIRGVRFDPRKARGKELGTITINAPKGQIGAVKPGQAVLKLETKPQNIVELVGSKAKRVKEPDIRIWANMEKSGKVKLDVRNLGGDILNKDIMKAVSEMPTQPGITPIMNLPASLRPVTPIKPIKPVITPATVKAPTPELQPLYTEASKYKSAEELQKMKKEAEILKQKAQETQSGNDVRAWRNLQNEIESIETDIAKEIGIKRDIQQRKIDETLRQADTTIDKLSKEDFDFLTSESKKVDNLDDFIGKVRGSATQYGEYNPKLRKYVRPESVFMGNIKGLNPNTKITVYRGIDSKSVTGKKIRNGDFVTTDYNDALQYTDSPSKVVSLQTRLKNLVAEYPDEVDISNPLNPVSYELLYNPTGKINKITKSQLTDIWNKANKVEPLVEDPKNFKTAEDYVKSQGELRYHQTFPENVSSIEKQGFRFDTRKSAVNDYLPVGVSTKSTPKEIGIFGKGKQLEVVIDKNSKVAQFNDRESLVKYLSDNSDEFNKAHAKIGVIDKKYNALHEELLNSNDITNLKENSSKLLNEWKIKVNKANQKAQEISTKFFKDKGVDVVQLNVDKGGFGKEIVDNTLVINPSKIKTKSQLISEWNKAQEAQIPTKPSIEPSFSRHYERIKEQYGFKDSVEFDRKTELVEKKKAFDFIQRSPEKALRIGYGYDEVPKGINQQVFRASLVASLNAQGKTVLAQEVAKIQSLKMTEAAQTLAFGRVDIGTEAGIIKNITQARLEKIGKSLGAKEPERLDTARKYVEKQAKDASKKVKEAQGGKNTAKQLKDIDNLINSIIC